MAIQKIKCLDGLEIDPETCSIEELESIVEKCKASEDYWNTMQLSAKTFINSVYGVFGTSFFNLSNIDIAESITLQGQDLIKYSVIKLNDYFKNMWHTDYEGHKRVSDIMINKYGYTDFDREKFEELAKQPLSFETLQAYGDSVVGNSEIMTDSGKMSIEDMFDEVCDSDSESKIRVKSNRKVYVLANGVPELREINYVMRHKTDKKIYKIESENGKVVHATSDHSIIVCRDGAIIECKPEELSTFDELLTINDYPDLGFIPSKVKSVTISEYSGEDNYVYDISVKVEDEDDLEHTFFANGICVHNTDSVSSDTIVRTSKHPEGIKIEDFYNENKDNVGDTTKAGHESVNTDDTILNAYNGELYDANIKRIIRHKVSKPKWKIVTSSGKIVYCTADHSLVVIRGGNQVVIKPNELQKGDKVITINK